MIWALFSRFALLGKIARVVPWQIWAALAVAAALGVLAWQIDSRAYNRGFAEADAQWVERITAERERQDAANAEAAKIAAEEIARLQEQRREADARILELIEEAKQDPNADRPALGVDSVRRLNQ